MIIFLAISAFAKAQMGTSLVRFSGNQIIYNPGYAGSHGLFSANLNFRQFWIGLPGAPNFFSLNAHSPFFSERSAVGFALQREQFGPMTLSFGNLTYAYQIPLESGILSFGVQAGAIMGVTDWNAIDGHVQPNDPGFGEGRVATTRFDASFGALYRTARFFVGLSARHLTMPRFESVLDTFNDDMWYLQTRMQFLLVGGYNFVLNELWTLRPDLLMRYIHTEPLAVSVGAMVTYDQRFSLGAHFFSTQRALSLSFSAQLFDGFKIGYAYDLHFGRLRSFQQGTHEIFISYSFSH